MKVLSLPRNRRYRYNSVKTDEKTLDQCLVEFLTGLGFNLEYKFNDHGYFDGLKIEGQKVYVSKSNAQVRIQSDTYNATSIAIIKRNREYLEKEFPKLKAKIESVVSFLKEQSKRRDEEQNRKDQMEAAISPFLGKCKLSTYSQTVTMPGDEGSWNDKWVFKFQWPSFELSEIDLLAKFKCSPSAYEKKLDRVQKSHNELMEVYNRIKEGIDA